MLSLLVLGMIFKTQPCMMRCLIFIIFMILPVQGFTSSYHTVNLAVFKNLQSLKNMINHFPPALKKTVQIREEGELYIAKTLSTENKKILEKLLPEYKKVFLDAYISIAKGSKDNSVKKQNAFHTTQQEKMKPTFPTNINQAIPMKNSLYDKVKQKTFYISYSRKKITNEEKLLIRVIFTKEKVYYDSVIGKMQSFNLKYKIKNNKLYFFKEGLFSSMTYTKLEKTTSNYYLISNWIKGKKINHLRYYFNLEDAKKMGL